MPSFDVNNNRIVQFVLVICAILAAVPAVHFIYKLVEPEIITEPKNRTEPNCRGATKLFSWNNLIVKKKDPADASKECFWFCQGAASSGTECHYGSKPPKPGCYVVIASNRSMYMDVSTVAEKLNADVHTPFAKKDLTNRSGYGCATPQDGDDGSDPDWWLLYDLNL